MVTDLRCSGKSMFSSEIIIVFYHNVLLPTCLAEEWSESIFETHFVAILLFLRPAKVVPDPLNAILQSGRLTFWEFSFSWTFQLKQDLNFQDQVYLGAKLCVLSHFVHSNDMGVNKPCTPTPLCNTQLPKDMKLELYLILYTLVVNIGVTLCG